MILLISDSENHIPDIGKFDADIYQCYVCFSPENIERRLQLQLSQSAVTSYFKEQSTGKWELQIPEYNTVSESHRLPIGFVTTGFVRGR